MNKKILVADDELYIREFINSFFKTTRAYSKCEVDLAKDGEEAIEKISRKRYDLIFTDLKMPKKTGLDVLSYVSEHCPDTDTVLITAYGGGESASKAMAYGAYEYLTKPVSIEELEMIINHIFERQELIQENKHYKEILQDEFVYPKLIGKTKVMSDIMDLVKMVAPTSSTVLITGESGTGKELVAEALHNLSNRKDHNYIKINCAAMPANLIESELFGFEKGAFTGAIKKTRGKFELADKGSILLDEISEMNLELQAKLLRVLQEREIVRIGGELPIKIDVRVIATSNKDLIKEVEKGNFREDLFFRLNIVPVHLPPLRERKEDIPSIAENFLKKICFQLGITKKSLKKESLSILTDYNWPGNIRELQNVIERAVITNRENILSPNSFSYLNNLRKKENLNISIPDLIDEPSTPSSQDNTVLNIAKTFDFEGKTLAEIERELIYYYLEKTSNNKKETADILGITTRTLRNKLNLYELR